MSSRSQTVLALSVSLAACTAPKAPRDAQRAAPPVVVHGALANDPLVAPLERQLVDLGATPGARVVAQPMGAGERRGAFVEVPEGQCLVVAARAAATVGDVDVALFDESGAVLASDEEPDARPTVVLCPPSPRRVFVLAHVVAGEGHVVLAAHHVSPRRAPLVRQRLAVGGDAARSSWPELEGAIGAHTTGPEGFWVEQRRAVLALDSAGPTYASLAVGEGECVKVVALPAPGSQLLDVELFSADGAPLGRARDRGSVRTAVVCARAPSALHVAMRPPLGRGLAALLVFAAPMRRVKLSRDAEDAWWLGGSLPLVERLVAMRQQQGVRVLKQLDLRTDRLTTVPVAAPGSSRCARLTVLAGAPARGVDVAVFDGASRRVVRGEGLDEETLYWCGAAPATIELIARDAGGPVAVLSREVDAPWAGGALKPDLAARIATALQRVGDEERIARGERAEVLAPERWPLRIERVIAAHSCSRSYWALGRPGAALEARAFDAGDGTVVDRQVGYDVVALTACAGASPRRVTFEIEASAPPEPATHVEVRGVSRLSSSTLGPPEEPSDRALDRPAREQGRPRGTRVQSAP